MHFCHSCFAAMVSFRYVLVFLKFFCSYFMSNKYSSKLILLNFWCQDIFLCKHIFLIDKEHTQWNLHTKTKGISRKYFMCHEILLKLYFMKCFEIKASYCILALNLSLSFCKTCFINSTDLLKGLSMAIIIITLA